MCSGLPDACVELLDACVGLFAQTDNHQLVRPFTGPLADDRASPINNAYIWN